MYPLFSVFRGGGGKGKKWHQDGRGAKKLNSIKDYIQCAKYLVENNIVEENKLAGWGYSAGGLVVASAINHCPDLFQAAVLKVIKNCGSKRFEALIDKETLKFIYYFFCSRFLFLIQLIL